MNFVGSFGVGNWRSFSMRRELLNGNYLQVCHALLRWKYVADYDCSKPGNKRCWGVWEREVAEKTVIDQHARIVGLLNDLCNAQAASSSSRPNDAEADGIGILIECIGDYEQMGAEATRFVDKVNGLQGCIQVLRK